MDGRVDGGTGIRRLVFCLVAVVLLACDSGAGSGDPAASTNSDDGERRVAAVEFRIGGHTNDPDYQFTEVRDIAILADHGFVVADWTGLRVASYSGRPMFAADGRIGLTHLGVAGHFGARIWLDSAGSIVREDTLPAFADEEMGYGRITWQRSDGSEDYTEILAPFGPRDRLAHARTGGYARAVTSRYEVDLYGADGVLLQTIRRDHSGPIVSSAERQREEFVIDSMAAFHEQQPFRVEYEPGEIPGQKPPIEEMWFDEGGRLWVKLWDTDGDSLARAHVYSGAGESSSMRHGRKGCRWRTGRSAAMWRSGSRRTSSMFPRL